jgi:ketosteroid isomerase-like protein
MSQQAIANLVYAYAERVGAGDIDGVADLFARATISGSGQPDPVRGRDAVAALYTRTFQQLDSASRKVHPVTSNLVVELDDATGTATARSYFTVFQASEPGRLQPVLAGRYDNAFARTDGEWHFTRRHVTVDLASPGSNAFWQEKDER